MFKEPFWSELFGQGQLQKAALAQAIRSSSKSCFGAICLVKFEEPFWRELFGQVQRTVLARAIWSIGASYLVNWRELFGQAQRANVGARSSESWRERIVSERERARERERDRVRERERER